MQVSEVNYDRVVRERESSVLLREPVVPLNGQEKVQHQPRASPLGQEINVDALYAITYCSQTVRITGPNKNKISLGSSTYTFLKRTFVPVNIATQGPLNNLTDTFR